MSLLKRNGYKTRGQEWIYFAPIFFKGFTETPYAFFYEGRFGARKPIHSRPSFLTLVRAVGHSDLVRAAGGTPWSLVS